MVHFLRPSFRGSFPSFLPTPGRDVEESECVAGLLNAPSGSEVGLKYLVVLADEGRQASVTRKLGAKSTALLARMAEVLNIQK
jgi:hypothetical protein